jgi:chorismate mutase-like protein
MDDLAGWRSRIDEIDAQVLKLINRRAEYALEIGRIKISQGKEILDSVREREIEARLCELNRGPLSDSDIQSIFKRIIDACRSLERE